MASLTKPYILPQEFTTNSATLTPAFAPDQAKLRPSSFFATTSFLGHSAEHIVQYHNQLAHLSLGTNIFQYLRQSYLGVVTEAFIRTLVFMRRPSNMSSYESLSPAFSEQHFRLLFPSDPSISLAFDETSMKPFSKISAFVALLCVICQIFVLEVFLRLFSVTHGAM